MSILNYGAAALFVVVGMAYGGYAGSGLDGFDYAGASMEERQQWLEARSISVRNKVNHAFARGDGKPDMWVRETAVDANAQRIDFMVGVSGYAAKDFDEGAAREYVLNGFCGRYVTSSIAEHGITVRLRIEYPDGREAVSLPITTDTCRQYAGV